MLLRVDSARLGQTDPGEDGEDVAHELADLVEAFLFSAYRALVRALVERLPLLGKQQDGCATNLLTLVVPDERLFVELARYDV